MAETADGGTHAGGAVGGGTVAVGAAAPAGVTGTAATPVESALIEEAARKSGLLWITAYRNGERLPARPAWHVWADSGVDGVPASVYVVTGGREQLLPPITEGDVVEITIGSKDKRGRLVTWPARAAFVEPSGAEWDAVIPALHAGRLNQTDGEQQPARWARESVVWRLSPDGQPLEQPGTMSPVSAAAPPLPTPAKTTGRQPKMIGGLRRKRRRR